MPVVRVPQSEVLMLHSHWLLQRIVLALFLAALVSCNLGVGLGPAVAGSGVVVTRSRPVAAFDRIEIGGDFDVNVVVGPRASVRLTGDDNLLPFVRTEVRGSTLHIDAERPIRPREEIEIAITTPNLRAAFSSGSSEVTISGVRSPSFRTTVSGSSHMRAEGAFGDLGAAVSGSGAIRMSGAADEIDGRVSGSGTLDLARVRARAADVRVSGSGDVAVAVTEHLNADVSGSGDVRYTGNPRVSRSISGSGSVRPSL